MSLIERPARLLRSGLVDVGIEPSEPPSPEQRHPHRLRRRRVARCVSARGRRRGEWGIDRVDLVREGVVVAVPVELDPARSAVRALLGALALVGLLRAEVPRGLQAGVEDGGGTGDGCVGRVLLGLQLGQLGKRQLSRRRRSRLAGWLDLCGCFCCGRRGRCFARRWRRSILPSGRGRWRRWVAIGHLVRVPWRRRRVDSHGLGDVVLRALLRACAVDVLRALLRRGVSGPAHIGRLVDESRLPRVIAAAVAVGAGRSPAIVSGPVLAALASSSAGSAASVATAARRARRHASIVVTV